MRWIRLSSSAVVILVHFRARAGRVKGWLYVYSRALGTGTGVGGLDVKTGVVSVQIFFL